MIQIDMDMPIDCRHCNFLTKICGEYRCIVLNDKIHESWGEKSLNDPLRPCNCPLKKVKENNS